MAIGKAMYNQYDAQQYLSSDEWRSSRSEAIRAARFAISSANNCDVDFPSQGLVNMVRDNAERGEKLLDYCNKTKLIPWSIAKRYVPQL